MGGSATTPTTNQRTLARDVRTDREGEIIARPGEWGARNLYWLRPVGGGVEWEVPREYVQLLTGGDAQEST